MKISACMIIKNEEKNIIKSLDSLKNIVDEMIVIDTGSSDASKEIAAIKGARVYDYVWKNDFADAKNFALQKAKGDWIIFLDADEYFSPDSPTLPEIMQACPEKMEALMMQMVNIDCNQHDKIIDQFFTVRVFRNGRGLSYRGRIHEQLVRADGNPLQIVHVPGDRIRIYHTGYSGDRMREKAKRNLAMLLAEYETTNKKEELYAYLAESYHGLAEEEKAVYYAKLDIEQGRRNVSYASRSCRIWIQALQKLNKPRSEIMVALCKAIELFPEMPEFRAEYGVCCFENMEYEKALAAMQEAIQLSEHYQSLEPSCFTKEMKIQAEKTLLELREFIRLEKSLKITACVIAKNEEKNIGKWLNCMRLCSDEMIVVDTGSTDQTMTIAKQAGAQVYSYVWDNHFANAKNEALNKANGDWILFLDADEYFSADTVSNVRKVIAREHVRKEEVDVILCTLVNIDIDRDNIELNRFQSIRLIRNTDTLRFRGNIHECVRPADRELRIYIENEHLKIYHTGYSSHIIDKKLRRNLDLLLEDIAKVGEGKQHYRYLMDCYHGMGEHNKAIHYAKLHLASDAGSIGTESDIYRTLINSMAIMKNDPQEIKPYIEQAMQKFQDIPDFYAFYAGILFRQNKQREAKPYLLKALAAYQQPHHTVNSSSFGSMVSETYSYLSEICQMEGNLAEAQKWINLSLQDNRYNVKAFSQMYNMIRDRPADEIIAHLDSIYDCHVQNYDFLLSQIGKYNDAVVYLHYAAISEEKFHHRTIMTEYLKLVSEKNGDDLYGHCLADRVVLLQKFVLAIFSLNDRRSYLQHIDILPESFQHIIKRYFDDDVVCTVEDYDAYLALMRKITMCQNDDIIMRYLLIGLDFSAEQRTKIFLSLCKAEQFLWANKFLTDDLLGEQVVNGEVLYYAAVMCYYLREWDTAKKYFAQARQMGFKQNDISSYIKWMKE